MSYARLPSLASSFLWFLRRIFKYFFENLPFMSPHQPIKAIWTKVVWNMEDYSINISVKKNSNTPNDLADIVNFHFFNLSMETICCHSNQSSYPTRIKNQRTNGPVKRSPDIWANYKNKIKFGSKWPNHFWEKPVLIFKCKWPWA